MPTNSAVGDLVAMAQQGHPQLTHVGFAEGILVAERVSGLDVHPIGYDGVPRITYSDPEVASVGLTSAQVTEHRLDIVEVNYPLGGNGKSIILQTQGTAKIIAERGPDGPGPGRVLGVHLVGSRVGELIAEGQLTSPKPTQGATKMPVSVSMPQLGKSVTDTTDDHCRKHRRRQSRPRGGLPESCGAKGSSVTSITDPEITAFLSAGTRTGKLAYVGMDGRPLVTPVWFIVEDGCIVFNTFHTSAKAKALARDPRATLCTDLQEPPYGFVQVQGEAELSEDPGERLRIATMIAARYVGPDRAEEFGKRNGVPGELIVRLRPTKVLAGFNLTG